MATPRERGEQRGTRPLNQERRDADGAPRSARDLLSEITGSLEAQKARDLAVIDLSGKSDIADFMVIASGNSRRQVVSMAERLMASLRTLGVKGLRPEGLSRGDWVLLDAGDVIVHLFRPEVREFYGLEKMWNAEFPDRREPAAV